VQTLAAGACLELGRFGEAVGRFEAVVEASGDEGAKALVRANVADARLTEALRTGAALSEADLEQLRGWMQATPAPASEFDEMARLHRTAMLRLAEGDPAQAVSLCERTFHWLDAQPGARSQPVWEVTAATLVIAYARSGRESDARDLLAQLATSNPLYEAAAAELSPSVKGSESEG
jgi:hypothetical protein